MIKSVVESKDGINFPCLMISKSNGCIILFEVEMSGVVIHNPNNKSNFPVGVYSYTWDMNQFKPFHGSVTLTQE